MICQRSILQRSFPAGARSSSVALLPPPPTLSAFTDGQLPLYKEQPQWARRRDYKGRIIKEGRGSANCCAWTNIGSGGQRGISRGELAVRTAGCC